MKRIFACILVISIMTFISSAIALAQDTKAIQTTGRVSDDTKRDIPESLLTQVPDTEPELTQKEPCVVNTQWSAEVGKAGRFIAITETGVKYKTTDGKEWKPMTKENNIEEIILLDVQGLFGGRDLWISGNGDAVVRFVGPRADGPLGLWQLCYSFKLSPEQQERLLQLIKAEDFYNINVPFRLGIHDEARPAIYIKGEKTYAVAKWETDMHSRFDAIYFYLREVAQSGKSGTKLEYSPFKWGWKPEGFTPSQQIWEMTTPVDPLR